MEKYKDPGRKMLSILLLGLIVLLPLTVLAEDTPVMVIEAAKLAIDQARKAGAEQQAVDDLSAAKSWLSQAEKAYEAAHSIMARVSTAKMKRDREEEVIYLATMAKIKGLTAEAKSKKQTTTAKLKETQKDLADYQSTIAVMKEKLREAEDAKEIQAKAEAERKHLGESQRVADEMEALKRKELEEAQRKTAELEAMKQKEVREGRLKDEKRIAEREKEAGQAKLKEAQLGAQRAQEALEIKAKEEKFAVEKEKVAAMQAKLQTLEQEKAMLIAAGKIPKVTAEAGDKKIIMTILAIDLFTSKSDLTPAGKNILDGVGDFLKSYPNSKVLTRGHTDSMGKTTANQAVSEKRAQKVREYLVAYRNVSPGRVTAEGVGSAQPVATNASEAGRTLNRRVELIVLTGEP
jgi:outer membrane protein OmpA-like peptidoglycan-associated protein